MHMKPLKILNKTECILHTRRNKKSEKEREREREWRGEGGPSRQADKEDSTCLIYFIHSIVWNTSIQQSEQHIGCLSSLVAALSMKVNGCSNNTRKPCWRRQHYCCLLCTCQNHRHRAYNAYRFVPTLPTQPGRWTVQCSVTWSRKKYPQEAWIPVYTLSQLPVPWLKERLALWQASLRDRP